VARRKSKPPPKQTLQVPPPYTPIVYGRTPRGGWWAYRYQLHLVTSCETKKKAAKQLRAIAKEIEVE